MKLKGLLKLMTPLLLLGYSTSWSDILPGPAQPEQVSRALRSQQPQRVPAQPGVIAPQEQTPPLGGPQAQKIKFKLNGIILEGNHVYSTAELRQLYQAKLHKTISIADLFNIVQSITNYYRNNGYILSRALLPPQHVKNGIVRVKIIEGFIDKVTVIGKPQGAYCWINVLGCKIKEYRPLHLSRMEKYLLLANETPNTQVKAVLAPSKKTTGAADLSLVTENRLFSGYLSYDNYGTRYIGPQQMTANIGLNSFAASGDAGQITFTKTPKGSELTYIDANYNAPINEEGTRWFLGSTRAQTHPLFVLAPADIDGLTNNYYTAFQMPIIRSRAQTLTFQTNFNYLDTYVTTFNQKLYTDHIRSIGFAGTYNFADRFYGANLIYVDLRQGLPIWGYSSDINPNTAQTSRPGGRADYTKVDLQISRLQSVYGAFSLYGLFKGQWAFNPLLASEQFTFGGPQLGRGYDVAEIIGDCGAAGTIEARYDWGVARFPVQSMQLYAFYDIGAMWNRSIAGGLQRKVSGTSTGFGARFYFMRYVSGNLMWTQTLTKPVAAEELIGQGRRPRVFFSVVASLQ